MDDIIAKALQASIANPKDEYEVDLIVDAASVGITNKLMSTDRKVEWTEDMLQSAAQTLKDMPVNLKFKEDGKIDPHSTTAIGRVAEVAYDPARKKLVAKSKLWKHYFPDTIEKLNQLYADGKAQVSVEFQPTAMETVDDETDRPTAGRFIGLGVVEEGADLGNFVHLLASAKKEEAAMKLEESRKHGVPVAGSFEWIGENLITHLNASASTEDYANMNVIGTFPDSAVWYSNGTYYKTPFVIDRTSIEFGDTIEVEQDFKPLIAAEPKSEDTPTTEPQKEAVKPMAEIAETELEALKASANKTPQLEEELKTLKASLKEKEDELEEANKFKADVEKEREDARLEKLAASRMEEVEKIAEYEDDKQRQEDLEAFKTMDEKSFNTVKRLIQASAAPKGGITEEGRIRNPFESSQDPDGEAKKFVESPEFKALVASVSAKKENE